MNTTQLFKLAGGVGVLGGILNIIAEFLPERAGQPLNFIVNLLLPWVLVALYLYQRREVGRLGFIGYVLNSFGLMLISGFLFAQAFVFPALDAALVQQLLAGTLGLSVVTGLVSLTLGVAIFGIATFRARVFPKWAAVLYVLGFLVVPAVTFIPRFIGLAAEIVISAAVMGMCYTLLTTLPKSEASTT